MKNIIKFLLIVKFSKNLSAEKYGACEDRENNIITKPTKIRLVFDQETGCVGECRLAT